MGHSNQLSVWRASFLPLAALLLGGSAPAVDRAADVRSSRTEAIQDCRAPIGWEVVTALKPRFVVFGEIHGTDEAPAFLGNLACALVEQGERILVAVEHSSTQDQAFQRAWRLPTDQFPQALKQSGWEDRDDGVGSQAMLALLVRLHQLSRWGGAIDIVAFNGVKDEAQSRRLAHLPGQGSHDAAQAENIRSAAAAHPYDHVLVLVGNAHASKRPVEHAGTTFEPMAMQLAARAPVVTLNMQTAGGTSWSCQLKDGVKASAGRPLKPNDIACGSYPLHRDADLRLAPFIAIGALPGSDIDPGYDGIFWLGTVSASPPAYTKR